MTYFEIRLGLPGLKLVAGLRPFSWAVRAHSLENWGRWNWRHVTGQFGPLTYGWSL